MVAIPQSSSLEPVLITGDDLCIADVLRIARCGAPVFPSGEARANVAASHETLLRLLDEGVQIYGLTTGVGALDCVSADPESDAQQRNLVRSHAAGVGEPMPPEEVRAMMAARLNTLARGASAIRPEVFDGLVELINRGITPYVPRMGSLGASDLAPLSHVALTLIGEGRASADGVYLAAGDALTSAGMRPLELRYRDGFAIINGVAYSTGTASLAIAESAELVVLAEATTALSLVALGGSATSFDERLARSKRQRGSIESAARLQELLGGWLAPSSDLREPLSTRAAHHIFGATRDAIAGAREVVEAELNADVDNPCIFADGQFTSNCANFHAQAMTETLDRLASSLTALGVATERRVCRLLEPVDAGQPPFLVHPEARAGLNSGLMIAQYTQAALIAELRMQSNFSATLSMPVCAGTEDVVPMCALAARRARSVHAIVQTLVAIELLCACQAVDARNAALPAALVPLYQTVRESVPTAYQDRIVASDIEDILYLIRSGALQGI